MLVEILVSAAILFLGGILQSALLPHLSIVGVKVDLVLLMVIAWSIRRGIAEGLIWAVLGGLALDVLSVGPFGLSILTCCLVTIIAGGAGPILRRTSVLLPLVLTPVLSIVATLVAALGLELLGRPTSWPATVALVVLPAAVLDSVAMLVVYPLVSAVEHRLTTVD
jgi:rod shape-determining protein MreD